MKDLEGSSALVALGAHARIVAIERAMFRAKAKRAGLWVLRFFAWLLIQFL